MRKKLIRPAGRTHARISPMHLNARNAVHGTKRNCRWIGPHITTTVADSPSKPVGPSATRRGDDRHRPSRPSRTSNGPAGRIRARISPTRPSVRSARRGTARIYRWTGPHMMAIVTDSPSEAADRNATRYETSERHWIGRTGRTTARTFRTLRNERTAIKRANSSNNQKCKRLANKNFFCNE